MSWLGWIAGVAAVTVLAGAAVVLLRSVRLVPTGHVGLVYRRFGRAAVDDLPVRVDHGVAGPRAATLLADRHYLLPPLLYDVAYVEQTVIPPGTIGVAVALAGAPLPPDRTLCRHVECDLFQDGRAFLLGGGQMGRQQAVLPGGGRYRVNPMLFEVITVDNIGSGRYDLTADDLQEVNVPEGATGVVVAREGARASEADGEVAPVVAGHASFQLPWVFLAGGGRRGAQAETLSRGGVYRINPWFARVIQIPTRDLILEWTKRTKSEDRFDVALDQIRIDVEGHWLRFDMSQTIRIPASAAPVLVGRFGEQEAGVSHPNPNPTSNRAPVQRFVERVLGRTVEGYFHSTAASHTVRSFMRRRDEVRLDLEDRVRAALSESGVIAVRTTLGEFEPESADLDQLRREIADQRERKEIIEYRKGNDELEQEIEQRRLETERDRRKLELVPLEERLRLLGREVVTRELLLERLAAMNVPTTIIGSDPREMLGYLPPRVWQSLVDQIFEQSGGLDQGGGSGRPELADAVKPGPAAGGVVPVYIVLDESSAGWLAAMDAGLSALCAALAADPGVAGAVQLSALGLAGEVAEHLALQEVRPGFHLSRPTARGPAHFGAAVSWLLGCIPHDVAELKRRHSAVRRPRVMWLTGSEPADPGEWRAGYRQLVDRSRHPFAPDVVACGIGSASAGTVAAVATGSRMAFIAPDLAPDVAAARFCDFVRGHVFDLGRAVRGGDPDVEIQGPAGFRAAAHTTAEGGGWP